MQAHHSGDQRQAEPEARLAATGIEPHKPIEYPTAIGLRNAGAVIGDGEFDLISSDLVRFRPEPPFLIIVAIAKCLMN